MLAQLVAAVGRFLFRFLSAKVLAVFVAADVVVPIALYGSLFSRNLSPLGFVLEFLKVTLICAALVIATVKMIRMRREMQQSSDEPLAGEK